jgi:hypothetical protein
MREPGRAGGSGSRRNEAPLGDPVLVNATCGAEGGARIQEISTGLGIPGRLAETAKSTLDMGREADRNKARGIGDA